MEFNPGFAIYPDYKNKNFIYDLDVFGPVAEKRYLNDIRKSLNNPLAVGPKVVYSIAMDVGRQKDQKDLVERNLLFGAVQYAAGKIDQGPIRSQGHVHGFSKSSHSSTPEVYEIWEGVAIIYMQEKAEVNPGRCFAVYAEVGDVVIVPPEWAHCAINASSQLPMTFGAWCIRDYSFDYTGIRSQQGIAHFPEFTPDNRIDWKPNESYQSSKLSICQARSYPEFKLVSETPIYSQYENNPELFRFVTNPTEYKTLWSNFEP